jgi:TetR/AcrR family transcriptional repressor of nem operon
MRHKIMRKSKAEAAETRQQIIDTASQEFRQNGIHATGLIGLMAKAGLTHGGFYRHFESKEQLVAEACSAALTNLVDGFTVRSGEGGFEAILDTYLTEGHRDDRGTGCPLAGMGSELARGDQQTREVAHKGFSDLVNVIAANMPDKSQAVFAMAAMVGALTLSRIIPDAEVSKSVLDDVNRHLKQM